MTMRFASCKFHQAALASLALAAGAQAAELMKPNIKPGLWEVSNSPQVSGEMPIPDEQLAKMTPEQRARMEAAFKTYLGSGAKPRVYKECMTPEKIARGFDIDRKGDDSACTRKVVSSSASELTLHDECNQPERKTVSDVHFEIKGGTQMSGKINVVMSSPGGKTMTVNSTVQGKWLSASCGSVKGIELEK
jgi:Protein of unknown function (DUF3617)